VSGTAPVLYPTTVFKWIKQHLRIKSFFGTSENAVKTQIWIAVSVYVLVAIIKGECEGKPINDAPDVARQFAAFNEPLSPGAFPSP
jgi:hypothetical protein